jgi:hypothetical protein
MASMTNPLDESSADAPETIKQDRLWRDNGWTARVIKNNDDDGWAVEMLRGSEPEPALVGPWTMGRDKKNPKPLDNAAFSTLVKTAAEVVRRHEQHLRAITHKEFSVVTEAGARINVLLDIVADEDDPHALLTAQDVAGERITQVRVAPGFKLSASTAREWIEADFRKPGGSIRS